VLSHNENNCFCKETIAARDGERHNDAVAFLDVLYGAARLDDFAHKFVAENIARLHRRNVAVVKMQIGAADARRSNLDNGVARINYFRVGYVFNPHIVLPFQHKAFIEFPLQQFGIKFTRGRTPKYL
jgi:hypothetical protein